MCGDELDSSGRRSSAYSPSVRFNPRIGGLVRLPRAGQPGVWVTLHIEEWNLHGQARLLAIDPCPPLQEGPGRLVLMKSSTRYVGALTKVQFVGADGTIDTITGTAAHPLLSLDAGAYVGLGSLGSGERVRTADGWATAETLARWWGAENVYNLEVDAEHRYLVGTVGVDSHNVGHNSGCGDGRKILDTVPKGITNMKNAQGDVFKSVHTPPSRPHAGMDSHTHPTYRNVAPDGSVRTGVSKEAREMSRRDIIDATRENAQRTGGK